MSPAGAVDIQVFKVKCIPGLAPGWLEPPLCCKFSRLLIPVRGESTSFAVAPPESPWKISYDIGLHHTFDSFAGFGLPQRGGVLTGRLPATLKFHNKSCSAPQPWFAS